MNYEAIKARREAQIQKRNEAQAREDERRAQARKEREETYARQMQEIKDKLRAGEWAKYSDVSDAMTVTKQSRLRSWPLWLAIASLVVFCVKEFSGIDISADMNAFLNVLLPVLVGFGIVDNPSDADNI